MYSDKKSILQLAALLRAHGIQKAVLCPGDWNAPIVHTLAHTEGLTCYPVTDVRSAGFFALGLAMQGGAPAAVCCTAGAPLLSLHPAVAEACRQQVPLVVISADRPATEPGQPLPQGGVFGTLVKHAVTLPEADDEESEHLCNRLLNEALLETSHRGKGPVHINIPLSEPLYRFTVKELPAVRTITRYQGLNVYDRDYRELLARLNGYSRRLVVVGQMNLIYLFEKKYVKALCKHFAWLAEHPANRTTPGMPVRNFDAAFSAMSPQKQESLAPELLITYGGQLLSRGLRKFLRNHPPREHWHISPDGRIEDPYGCLTTVIEMDPFEFLEKIAFLLENKPVNYPLAWENFCKTVPQPQLPYCGVSSVGKLLQALPESCALHLANGSVARYAQLFALPPQAEVCCNCGAGSMEGALSTAIGYAVSSPRLNFVLTGDLAFFCDMNALWGDNFTANLRILLLNNGGAAQFNALPGMDKSGGSRPFITAEHRTTARSWAEERGFTYLSATTDEELTGALLQFASPDAQPHPLLLEVFTDKEQDATLFREYYRELKELTI